MLEVTRQPSLIVDDDARITFFVRESDDHARVAIVDRSEDVVRTLDPDVELTEGEEVTYEWDRSTDAGGRARPGRYRLLVELLRGPGDGLATADDAGHGVRRRRLNASALELAGMLIACGSAAAALLVDGRRTRVLVMAVALAAAPVLVLGDVWDESRVVDFRESPAQVGAALVIGVIALAALVLVFRRWREAFPIATFAVLPLRVLVEIAETAHLLVPLYVVIAARPITFALDDAGAPRAEDDDRWSIWLRRLLAATLVLYAIQAAYSEDVSNAIENIGFFLVPFAVMFALLAAVDWTWRCSAGCSPWSPESPSSARRSRYQWSARDLFLNPELFDSNQLHVYFPRQLALLRPQHPRPLPRAGDHGAGAYMAWSGERRGLAPAAIAAGVCLIGLVVSLDHQLRPARRARHRRAAGAGGEPPWQPPRPRGLAGLAIAGGTPTSDIQDYRSIDSGRESLLEGGVQLFEEKPTAGWGSGAFGRAFYEEIEQARSTISHSEPVTVAAEQGVIGLAVYVAFLFTALIALRPRPRVAPRATVAACFVAVFVHSLGYAGFAIDPVTWALLGLGVALRRGPPDDSVTI